MMKSLTDLLAAAKPLREAPEQYRGALFSEYFHTITQLNLLKYDPAKAHELALNNAKELWRELEKKAYKNPGAQDR